MLDRRKLLLLIQRLAEKMRSPVKMDNIPLIRHMETGKMPPPHNVRLSMIIPRSVKEIIPECLMLL